MIEVGQIQEGRALEQLDSATGIGGVVAQHARADCVGPAAGPALAATILAVDTPAGIKLGLLIARVARVNQFGDVGRIILAVAVQGGDPGAARDGGEAQTKLYAGWRVNRQDSGSKRWASKWANAIRSRMLRDATPDTGCGIKLFEREAFLDLPYFDHMHRYLPALMQRAGWKTISVPVNHRHRTAGVSKYNNLNRALVGISDLRGVAWLIKRGKRTAVREL